MSDQADGLRRLVRSKGGPSPPREAPPPRPKPRPDGLLAAIAARWGRARRDRADSPA